MTDSILPNATVAVGSVRFGNYYRYYRRGRRGSRRLASTVGQT